MKIFNLFFFVVESLYSISKNSENTHLSEIRTNVVLLSDSGGRFKRDLNVSSVTEDHTSEPNLEEHKVIEDHPKDDDNKIYSSNENGSSRGHTLENVDITEEKINQMTKSHENDFSFENVSFLKLF